MSIKKYLLLFVAILILFLTVSDIFFNVKIEKSRYYIFALFALLIILFYNIRNKK